MPDHQDVIAPITEIDQKIKDNETLLRDAQAKSTATWVVTAGCAGLFLFNMGGAVFKILILLYIGFNIWRISQAESDKRRIEKILEDLRDQKAKFQASTPPITMG